MDYEIVELSEKTVVGICARTNNASEDMQKIIGDLWNRFYNDGIYESISYKSNSKALGIYTDYEDDEKADYTVFIACEVDKVFLDASNVTVKKIPSGKYAKFIIKGDVRTAVAEFWSELWKMKLPRSYVCDFEEYQDCDMENSEIHIYIGLRNEDI